MGADLCSHCVKRPVFRAELCSRCHSYQYRHNGELPPVEALRVAGNDATQVAVKMPEEMRIRAQAFADRLGISLTEWIRNAIAKALLSNPNRKRMS